MSKGSGKWRWIAAIGVVVVSAAIVLMRLDAGNAGDRPTSASAPMEMAAPGRDASAPLEPAAEGRRDSMPAAGPLPPIDTPFRLALDELQRRARAGDPAAMCRLAAEHAKCKQLRRMLDVTSEIMDLQQAGVLGGRDAAARAKRLAQAAKHGNELLEKSRHCEGVPEIGDRELVHQWRAAARAGSLPALEHYALGAAFPRDKMLSFLPELATYRGEAESMARRLAETGGNEALMRLGLAYMPEGHAIGFTPLLAQVVEQAQAQRIGDEPHRFRVTQDTNVRGRSLHQPPPFPLFNYPISFKFL